MAIAPEQLKNIEIRNQVLLEGLKQGEHEKFAKFLRKLSVDVTNRLRSEGETVASKRRLQILISDLTKIQNVIYFEYVDLLRSDLEEVTIDQAEFESKALDKTVKNFESVIPAPSQLLVSARVAPLSVQGLTGKPLLQPFIKDWTETSINRVNNIVQQGFAQGRTTNQMVIAIRGTKQQKFENGELARINRDNAAIVRTSVQHVASVARTEVMKENDDVVKGYEWVSTLDSRTTSQCRGLDGQEFKIGEGPLPPIHVNCRSTTVAVLDERFDFLDADAKRPAVGEEKIGQVAADMTYYQWLKTQSAAFQNSVIGVTRGKLLRNGGLTADEFARLSLDKNNFQPLTLDEMRNLRPEVFEEANV